MPAVLKTLFARILKHPTQPPTKGEGHELRTSFTQTQSAPDQPDAHQRLTFIYCLVGNIVEERFDKMRNQVVRGTRHFSPGTKVFCFPEAWGDGYENIKVIGKHRKSPKLVTMVIPSRHVTAWRLKAVYTPFIIKRMNQNNGWTNTETDKHRILMMVQWLTKQK